MEINDECNLDAAEDLRSAPAGKLRAGTKEESQLFRNEGDGSGVIDSLRFGDVVFAGCCGLPGSDRLLFGEGVMRMNMLASAILQHGLVYGIFEGRTGSHMNESTSEKISWQGEIQSIQPRTRVWRYLTDNRTHYHLGYNFFIEGLCSEGKRQFVIAVSENQQSKGLYRIGDILSGTAWTKKYEEREFADYYRAGSIKINNRAIEGNIPAAPPWIKMPPSMETYQKRGARILSKRLWETKCFQCIWANMANAEIQWDFDKDIKKYRFESFCYGPKSCKSYRMGRPRSVPYKNRYTAIDDGFLDALCTEGRDSEEE